MQCWATCPVLCRNIHACAIDELHLTLGMCMCRSVTMDAWSPDQLRKMQLGGNDTLNNFLGKYSVDKFTEIKDKYNSQAAEVSCCPFRTATSCWDLLSCLQFFIACAMLPMPAKVRDCQGTACCLLRSTG